MGASVWDPDGPLTPVEVTSLQDQVDAIELLLAALQLELDASELALTNYAASLASTVGTSLIGTVGGHTLANIVYDPPGFVESNIFIGDGGRYLSHTGALEGYYQVGVGFRCLWAVTTGSYNTGVGFETLNYTTTGSYNSCFGEAAFIYNVTGSFNTACGWKAGMGQPTGHVSSSYNTYIGASAGISAHTGDGNTACGAYALSNNPMTGSHNTAVGRSALSHLTTGNYNTAVGYLAGNALTTGDRNLLCGYSAAFSLTSGSQNIIWGDVAGYELTTGGSNTFIGTNAGRGITTGSNNVFLGFWSGLPAATQNTIGIATGGGVKRLFIDATAANIYASDGATVNLGVTDAGDMTVRTTITVGGGANPILKTTTTASSGAGIASGTLSNAPTAGNPTKWLIFNDAGTTRYIPAW